MSFINEVQRVAAFLSRNNESVRAPNQLAVTQVALTCGLAFTVLQSFLGATTAHSIPLADARKLTFLCGEQNVHEEFRSSSSASFGKQFGALCLASTLQQGCGRPCSRSRLRCRCAGSHPSAGSFFFLPSEQIDTKDGLENYCDKLVDDCGDARATSWWQRAARIGLLPAPNSITNPECKSAPQSSKDSIFLDVTMFECCAGCQSHGEGVFSSAECLLVLDVTALVTGS